MSREHAIARKLCALYPSDRWAFLRMPQPRGDRRRRPRTGATAEGYAEGLGACR
jgi:hypothetical protein